MPPLSHCLSNTLRTPAGFEVSGSPVGEDPQIGNVGERAGLLMESAVNEAIGVVHRMGLSLDCWLYHTQLDEVAQLATPIQS